MIANCAELGLDWQQASLSDYLEAIEAHNEASSPQPERKEPSDWMRNAIRNGVWH